MEFFKGSQIILMWRPRVKFQECKLSIAVSIISISAKISCLLAKSIWRIGSDEFSKSAVSSLTAKRLFSKSEELGFESQSGFVHFSVIDKRVREPKFCVSSGIGVTFVKSRFSSMWSVWVSWTHRSGENCIARDFCEENVWIEKSRVQFSNCVAVVVPKVLFSHMS